MPPADRYEASLAELSGSTVRLVAAVRALDDAALREPSLLPGWTRGHVVAHLARNADGLVNLATWARTGVETPMYPGGRATRDADIERDAGRPASEQVADTEAASERLAAALADLPAGALGVELRLGSGTTIPAGLLPLRRIREVEIHLVDLAAGLPPHRLVARLRGAHPGRADAVHPQLPDRRAPRPGHRTVVGARARPAGPDRPRAGPARLAGRPRRRDRAVLRRDRFGTVRTAVAMSAG